MEPIAAATLPELFEAQVAKNAEGTAVVFEEESLTYGELNYRANQLAHLLMAEGIGPESIVALALPRSLEMMVALLGILKAGAAYLPLDPEYPAERLAFMLEDAQPRQVLTVAESAGALPAGTACLRLDDPAVQRRLAASSERTQARRSECSR